MRYNAKQRRTHKRALLRAATPNALGSYEDATQYIREDGSISWEDPFPPNECRPLTVHCDPHAMPVTFLRDYRLTGKHKGHDATKVAEWYRSRGINVAAKRSKRHGGAVVTVAASPPPEETPKQYLCTVTTPEGILTQFTVTCKGSHEAGGIARSHGKIESIENL